MRNQFKKSRLSVTVQSLMATGALVFSPSLLAQADPAQDEQSEALEEIVVTGIRRSLQDAADMKRSSEQIMDAITAEDIGKLPDENAADALKRVTGVQIDNRNGQGSQIRLRGMSQVKIELNGASYIGTGGQSGFRDALDRNVTLEDIPSELLSSIEVIKAPSADMTEGGLTGTVRMNTRDPLDLPETYLSGSMKNTYSEIADEDAQTYSVFFGKNWDDRIGFMLNVVDGESLTRNDSINYRRWDAIPFLGANPEQSGTPHFVTAEDGQGRTAVALAPQEISMEQRQVLQDRTTVDLKLQLRPTDELNFWVNGVYTEYDESVSTNTLTYGLYDINTGAGIALDDFHDLSFGQFTPGTTARGEDGNLLDVDGEVTLLGGGFRIPSAATGGDSHAANGQVGVRDVINTNVSAGGSWTGEDLTVTAMINTGRSKFDSAWMSQSLKGSYGNINCAWRDPRPLDPYSGQPVECAENLRFGYDMGAGELGSIFVDPTLSGVNPTVDGGGDYLTDPYSYAVGFVSLYKDLFETTHDSLQLDFDWDVDWVGGINAVEFGVRSAGQSHSRVAERGVGTHWRQECTLEEYQLSPQECADNGALFTDVRIGMEDANSIYFQPEERRDVAMITDGTYMRNVPDAGEFPDRWISGNPHVFADDPLGSLADIWGMYPMADKTQDYFIEEDTLAGYAKLNFELVDPALTGNFGVRVVETEVNSRSHAVAEGAISQILHDDLYRIEDYVAQRESNSYVDVLPSVNVNWNFTDDWLLRFAANRAMSRPDMGALVPGETVTNVNSREGRVGNPDLDPWRVNQADLSLEWYHPDGMGNASAAVFHKDFVSFITSRSDILFECRARGQTETCTGTQSINGSGEAQGLELSYNQPLPLGFGAVANYTYLDSSTPSGAPVPGMSEHTYNLIGYYEDYGFGARLAWTWQDGAMTSLAGFNGRPQYSRDRGQLDLSLNYDYGEHLSFTLSGVNLTREGERFYTQIDERLNQVQQFDRTIVFSVRARL